MVKKEQSAADQPAGLPAGVSKLPRKKMYRARAHSNPLSDQQFEVPETPDAVNWASLYPSFFQSQQGEGIAMTTQQAEKPFVRFADIGCGFGGLTIELAKQYPDTLVVGMELRLKVSEYVRQRIESLRLEHPGQYGNCSCVRTNAMKFLPHYFQKGQLTKMFFLFPDPHFKVANHRRRIINTPLLTEYAYVLAPGGMLYTITDVEELGDWMRSKLEAHPLFERVSEEELEKDIAAGLLAQATEEGQKVARNGGKTWRHVYRRLEAPRAIDSNPEKLQSRR